MYSSLQDTEMTKHLQFSMWYFLDLNMVTDVEYLPPLGYSDHEVLLRSCVCYSDSLIPTCNNKTYDYFRGDYDAANDYFNTIAIYW